MSEQQATVFSALRNIDTAFNKMASQAAKTQDLLVDEGKATVGSRQFMAATSGWTYFGAL